MVGRDKAKPFPARGIGMNAGPVGRTADWHGRRPYEALTLIPAYIVVLIEK
jgi:hypothetical protein